MPQQYMLINRPVIVSKHNINVISHGRPQSPVEPVSSMSPYIRRLVVEGSKYTNHGDSIQSCDKLEPAVSLVGYQKSVQDNLISINNNLSDMLKETISGIDIICQKVRLCLLEANSVSIIKMHDSKKIMCICEETVDEVEDIEEEAIAEIVEEETPDEDANKVEDEISIEADTQKSLENSNSIVQGSAETQKRNSSLTPFFTILNPKTLSVESVAVQGLRSVTSKLGLSRKCTAEHFLKSMQEVAKLNNYENFLSHMVNDVNEGINRYYRNFKEECKSREMNRSMDKILKSSLESQDSRIMYQMMTTKMEEKIKKLQNDTSTKMERDFNRSQDISTLRMATSNIKEKIEKLQNALKIRRAKKTVDVSLGNITFPCGEVYRKRALTDLNKRMNMQVEANDSLICFQKLMDKNQKHIMNMPKTKNGKLTSGNICVARSPLHQILINEQRQRQNARNADLAKMYRDSLWFKGKYRDEKRPKRESNTKKKHGGKSLKNEKCLPTSYTVQSVSNVPDKSYPMKKSSKHSTKGVLSVSTTTEIPNKYEVSITNNQPLSKPDKCKMFWMRSKYAQLTKKKLQYMDILDNITKNNILPLKSEYPRRDQVVKSEKPKVDNIKDSYLYKLLHAKENEKVWTKLLKPTIQCSNGNCRKCSKTEVFERPEDKGFDKDEVRRSLSKYIFADIDQIQRNQVFTVMPVQISYDNPRIAVGAAKRSQLLPPKLPLLPMKETKDDIRRAEWSSENNRKPKPKKVVFDPILRKIEKEIKMVSARESKHISPKLPTITSWSPKNFNQFYTTSHQSSGFKMVKIDSLDKVSKKQQSKIVPNQVCKAANIMERRPRKRLVSSTEHSAVELNVEKNIQKELEIQYSKLRNVQERKIWENKYGKSVGQKLFNFVEKQPSAYEIPVPKYALPKTIKDPKKQRQMLEKLRVLKHKNDNIQNNIVKAIQVIENKMMDVLCKPAESIDAFEKMEKEITQVLSLMKTCKEGSQQEAYSDMNQLSEDLFKRLDMILEQPGSAKQNVQKPKRKMKTNEPQKSSGSDMQTVCFSSLSPSGEEKFTVTAISPKSSSKHPIIPSPKIILPTVTTNDKEFEKINSKLREVRNNLGLQGCSDQLEVRLLDDIEESKLEKNVEQKKEQITETVINIALVEHKYAGDTKENLHNSKEESPLHSTGDGQSEKCISAKIEGSTESTLPNNPDETYSSQYVRASSQEYFSNQQYSNIDTQQLGSQEVVADEEMPLDGFTDLSEQYYTPITSPMVGFRDREALQKKNVIQFEPHDFGMELAKPLEGLNEDASSSDRECFYDNVNKIIARVESVYNQLAQFEEIGLEEQQDSEQCLPKIPVFQDPPKMEDLEADSFLTPFMHAVKDLRKSVTDTTKSIKSSPRLYRSPSYFNVLSFLDTLTDLEERAVEVQTARVLRYSYSCHNSTIFEQAIIQNQSIKIIEPVQEPISECLEKTSSYLSMTSATSTSPREINEPKEISGCLKKTSSYLSMFTATTTNQSDEEETNVLTKTSSYLSMITATSTNQSDDEEIKVTKKITGCLKKPSNHLGIKVMSTIQNDEEKIIVPKKISGCLKKPSSLITVTSKSKQKVSFLLQKEEKATQVVEGPVHKSSSRECLSRLSSLIFNNKKDEQVSAYLDVLECKSVDKMSLSDEEDSFKSNFDLSDEISLESEQTLQNSLETAENKKKVKIFRNNISEEKCKDVKVLYNNYKETDEAEENINYQIQIINGKFNETSILQAKKYLTKDVPFKKDKIFENIHLELILKQMLKESSLLEPIKDVHSFIDTKLLKDTIEERQKIRMNRNKSRILTHNNYKNEKCCERETFLKGVYICVYLFMFTALKLNLNLECCVD